MLSKWSFRAEERMYSFFKTERFALARWLGWLARHPVPTKAVGSAPRQGTPHVSGLIPGPQGQCARLSGVPSSWASRHRASCRCPVGSSRALGVGASVPKRTRSLPPDRSVLKMKHILINTCHCSQCVSVFWGEGAIFVGLPALEPSPSYPCPSLLLCSPSQFCEFSHYFSTRGLMA